MGQQWAALRRKESGLAAWRVTKAIEPIVTAGAIVLPELMFTRDDTTVALIGAPADDNAGPWHPALRDLAGIRHIVASGATVDAVTALTTPDATALLSLLDEIDTQNDIAATPVHLLRTEVNADGWVGRRRLEDVLGVTTEAEIAARLRPLTVDGEAAFIASFGVCRVSLLDDLLDQIGVGPVDISTARRAVAEAVGESAGADALTLYLLDQSSVIRPPRTVEAAA